MRELSEVRAKSSGLTWEQLTGYFASTAHTRRVMVLNEVADMAVFMASDKASGMTGTTVNLSMGALPD
jgi:enoyl-[acyl-carrier-protein] reductase (NADH)